MTRMARRAKEQRRRKIRYITDPAYRAKVNARWRRCKTNRYHNNPEYRAKVLARAAGRYIRRHATVTCKCCGSTFERTASHMFLCSELCRDEAERKSRANRNERQRLKRWLAEGPPKKKTRLTLDERRARARIAAEKGRRKRALAYRVLTELGINLEV